MLRFTNKPVPARRRLVPVALTVLLTVIGCQSLGEKDAVQIAREVTQYRKRGNKLLKDIEDERRRAAQPRSPYAYVDKMKKACSYFGEAVALAETSATPRQEFGRSLQLVGNTYYLEYVRLRAEMAQLTAAGQAVPKKLLQGRNEAWALTESYLQQSNREYQYYINYLHARSPRPELFNELRANYEILQFWEDAAYATQMFLSETRGFLGEEQAAMFRKMLFVYEDKVAAGIAPERP